MRSIPAIPVFTRRLKVLLYTVMLIVGSGIPFFGTDARHASPVQAADVTGLQKQKAALEQQAKQAEYDALQQKSLADRAAARVAQAATQATQLKDSIQTTRKAIDDTKDQVDQKNEDLAQKEVQLHDIQEQLNALVREMYIQVVSKPEILRLFSDEPVSRREQEQAQLQAIRNYVAVVGDKARDSKRVVELSRDDLVRQQNALEGLNDQQKEQVQGLADVQAEQAQLRDNAVATETALEARAQQAKAQENTIEQQISAELAAIVAARNKGKAISGGQNTGQRVSRGAIVGHEGSTGNSTGPHVHFECRSDNVAVNCQPYVDNGTAAYPLSNFVVTH